MSGRHLSRERLLLAVEGGAHDDAHLDACAQCRAEVDALRGIVRDLRDLDAPEPSPLFWDALSRRIQRAIRDEPKTAVSRRAAWAPWLAWASGLTTAAALSLMSFVPRDRVLGEASNEAVAAREVTVTAAGSTVPEGEPSPDGDWQFLLDVAASADGWADVAMSANIGDADTLVADFSAEERARLIDLLKMESAEYHR